MNKQSQFSYQDEVFCKHGAIIATCYTIDIEKGYFLYLFQLKVIDLSGGWSGEGNT